MWQHLELPRGGFPIRTSSSPSLWRAIPMFSVEARMRVSWKIRSQVSTASQRSSSGVRFQRWHFLHTTQSRPFAASKASLRPMGKASTTSFDSRGRLQKIQVWYTDSPVGCLGRQCRCRARKMRRGGRSGPVARCGAA